MERLKALIREPALLLDAFESLVVVLIALGVFNLSGDQQTNLVALFIALLAFAKGFLTRPFPVTVVPDLGRAGLVFCVSLGLLNLTADQVTLIATFLGTLMTVIQRAQITPRYDPVARAGGAGAGPIADSGGVRREAGSTDAVYIAGIVLILLGLLDLLLLAVGTAPLPLLWAIILIVLGAVLFAFSTRRPRL